MPVADFLIDPIAPPQIDHLRFTQHGGETVVRQNAVYCTTLPQRWQYALSYELPDTVRNTRADLVISVYARIILGKIGAGFVKEDGSSYICEENFDTDATELRLILRAKDARAAHKLVLRNTAEGNVPSEIHVLEISIDAATENDLPSTLAAVTRQPFKPKAKRMLRPKIASINTTEVCNLSCVMCHFNGPHAIKKNAQLKPIQVEKILDQIPAGEEVWFCATGEFFIDENAVDYLRMASTLGLRPCVLSHGQLFTRELIDQVLNAGVRRIRMSVDSTDADTYRKIRRGGELHKIVEACQYFRQLKASAFPDLHIGINATLFAKTFAKQAEMEAFWRPLADEVNFNAEYFNTLQFRNLFFVPAKRVDCDLQMYVMPSGRIAPCCAIAVYQHNNDVSWLPHVDEINSLEEAQNKIYELYEDTSGPMSKICQKCDWWILSMSSNSPYMRQVQFDTPEK